MALTDKLTAIADAIREKGGTSDTLTLAEMPQAIAALPSGGTEEDTTEFSQQNSKVTEYMAAAEVYTDADFASVTVANNYTDSTQTTWERPNGTALTAAEAGRVYIMDEETGKGWNNSVSVGENTIINLVPGHWHSCLVRNNDGMITGIARVKGSGQVRMIYVPNSVHNFRDIGGWPCDGGTVKYGMVYRGAQLSFYSSGSNAVYSLIDSTGIHYLRDICGIRCEIDMRTDAQVTGISSSPLGEDVEYIHYPYSDASYTDIVNPTGSYAAQTKAMITKIMENMAKGVPTYIHCQAGADRTGVICMVLEALLGVAGRDCDKDFELTTFYYQGSYYRPRTDSNWVALRNYINGLPGNTLRDKAVSWCKLIGIQASIINRYRKAMIVGTPEDISYQNYVAYSMNNVSSSNTASIVNDGDSYTTTLSANSGYTLSSVTVTMGGIDITDSVYSADTGTVSIPAVTGDVVITAAAVASRTDVLRQSVSSDGTPYNGGTGYKSGYRLNSGGKEAAASGVYCSGFIPITNAQTIEFEGISLPAVPGVSNSNYTIHFYNSVFTRIAMTQYQAHNVFLTPSIGAGTKDESGNYIKTFKPTGVSGLAYIRFSCGMIDDGSKVYVYD